MKAVEAYTGPFLDGLHISGAGDFSRWAEEKRDAFSHAYVKALTALASAASEAGDYALAVTYARRAAASEPLSAVVARTLMVSLFHLGDRTAALDAGRIHSSLVREELRRSPTRR